MPKHLRIVIGIMILGILMRIIFLSLFFSQMINTYRWVGDLIAILITIGMIKGFITRSVIAWHLAKVLAILGLFAGCFILRICFLASNTPSWLWLFILVGIGAEIYGLWVLFSCEVRCYFVEKKEFRPDNRI